MLMFHAVRASCYCGFVTAQIGHDFIFVYPISVICFILAATRMYKTTKLIG